jgi:hypothetical protein
MEQHIPMKRTALALAIALLPSVAWAQCTGIFPPNTVCGNFSGVSAPPGAASISSGVLGPGTSTVNGLPLWSNAVGTVLKDGNGQTVAGTYTWGGTQTYSSNSINTYTGSTTLSLSISNPLGAFNSPGDRAALIVNVGFDGSNSATGFPAMYGQEIFVNASHGQNNYGNLTFNKSTFLALDLQGTYTAAGQKDIWGYNLTCLSKGDCSIGQEFVTFASMPTSGDEGQGFHLVSLLTQLTQTSLSQVSSLTRNTCNTTLTQAVTGSLTAQTVTIASGTGCTVGTWVVFNTEPPTGSSNHEAVQITASTSTSLTGVIASNYNNGMTITPATDMHVTTTQNFGEGRILVNLTATPYTTGTITGKSGGGLIGTGTGWSSTMLTGGTSINPGCLTMAADDYSSDPFGTGNAALHDYYQIYNLIDATHLGVYAVTVAGDQAYKGKGPGSGAYRVLPCAEILRVLGGAEIILDTNGFTWNVNDTIEAAIPPYPDVSGIQWHFAIFSNGGIYRSFMDISNYGARKINTGITIGAHTGPIANNLPGADNTAYQTAIYIEDVDIGIAIGTGTVKQTQVAAIRLPCPNCGDGGPDASTQIQWRGSNIAFIGMNSVNSGMDFKMTTDSGSTIGFLQGHSAVVVGGTIPFLTWSGIFAPYLVHVSGLPTCNATFEGGLINVDDSNQNTFGATITGGGANHVLARCNKVNWTVAGA